MEQSSLTRLAGVLTSPAKTFESIAQRPTWLIAIVVLILVGTVTAYIAVDRIDFEEEIRVQLEKRSQPVPDGEALEKAAALQKVISWAVAPVIFGFVFYLLAALMFWMSFKLTGSDLDYKTALSTTLHGYVPAAVKALVSIPVILGRAEISAEELQSGALLKSNLAFLAPEEAGAVLVAVLSSVDLFSVWCIALLAIGFAVTAKVPKKTATITVICVWLLGVAFKLGFAALGQAFSG